MSLATCCECGASCTDDIDRDLNAQYCGWDHCTVYAV